MNMTKARVRVLEKARAGKLMILGGFGGDTADIKPVSSPIFEHRTAVLVLLQAGLVQAGDGFNQYELTEVGKALLDAAPACLRSGHVPKRREPKAAVETIRSVDGA